MISLTLKSFWLIEAVLQRRVHYIKTPDGPKEGGSQPTDISVINRRVLLAPALPMDTDQEDEEHARTSVAHS